MRWKIRKRENDMTNKENSLPEEELDMTLESLHESEEYFDECFHNLLRQGNLYPCGRGGIASSPF